MGAEKEQPWMAAPLSLTLLAFYGIFATDLWK
jgi:hypothetical protein